MYFLRQIRTPVNSDSAASGHICTSLQAKTTDFTPANPEDSDNPENLVQADLLFVEYLQEGLYIFSAPLNLQETSKYMAPACSYSL